MDSSYVNCGKLRSLRPVLKEWIRLNSLYCKRALWKDCAWWANERASTSILAAAVWTLDGVALEEYSTAKVRKRKHRTGRCDLYIDIGTEKFACEAKQVFPKLKTGRTNNISEVKAAFDLAINDARNLYPQEGRRIGICFVTPRFPRSQISFNDCLKDYLNSLQKLEFDAIAWYFPDKARHMEWKPNQQLYPGVILLIREIFRGA